MAGRLDTVEKEISSLKDRVASLEGEVGVSGSGAGAGAAPVVEEAAPALMARKVSAIKEDEDDEDDAALLAYGKGEKKTSTIKERIATAEADVGTLKSQVQTLMNQVTGGAVLLELETQKKHKGRGSNLIDRLENLEA